MSGVIVTFSDFRQIGDGREPGKADPLFRAAVSAFCSLTRPSRCEITQIEDLTLPLFDTVSAEARRYAAVELAKIDHAPPTLIRRLSEEPTSISAPLLMHSKQLSDIDLIRLIARYGLPHARAILRRPYLNPAIGNLVRAMERPSAMQPETDDTSPPLPVKGTESRNDAEIVRQKLRAMMVSSQDTAERGLRQPLDRTRAFTKLCSAALSGQNQLFHTTLASTLGIDADKARSICEATNRDELIMAFRSIGLEAEQAFLLASVIRLGSFQQIADIRQFLEEYRLCDTQTARKNLKRVLQVAPEQPQLRIFKAS